MSNRWRYIAHGAIGHIWEDTLNRRYVISDKLGPDAYVFDEATGQGGKRGARRPDSSQFKDTREAQRR
jgi:hypothetical protein